MALTHTTAIRAAMASAVLTAIDTTTGGGDTTGDLVFMTTASAAVATLTWSATPAFATNAGATWTMNAINDDTSATGGTVGLFKFQNRNNVEVFRGTVTATGGGGDIEMSSLAVGSGDTVSVTSFTYTAAP